TGILVQDAAFMVGVPNVASDVPALKKNPVFFYFHDHFQRPNPFRTDVAIDITEVFDQKIHALDAHESQFYEWLPWIGRYEADIPKEKAARKKGLAGNRAGRITPEIRAALEKWYGPRAADV